MSEIVFYTHPMSRGRTVRWMLEEVGEPYRTAILDWEGVKSPGYKAVNPMGKVPAVVHGGTVVTEVAAICAYLADAFPARALAPPPRDPARGAYYRWLMFSAGPLEAAIMNEAAGYAVAAEHQRMLGFGTLNQALDVLEDAVRGRDHLAGNRFTAADLFTSSLLGFATKVGIVGKRPEFERYVGVHLARPAAVKAAAIDDALLAKSEPG